MTEKEKHFFKGALGIFLLKADGAHKISILEEKAKPLFRPQIQKRKDE
jgi:hypothetical protein